MNVFSDFGVKNDIHVLVFTNNIMEENCITQPAERRLSLLTRQNELNSNLGLGSHKHFKKEEEEGI